MKEIDWDQVTNLAILLAAVAFIITGNEGWGFLFLLGWLFR